MVSASKILTVSYGTFSCTLEGFDDPFSTMRSIAEYFRDLAADDRYFGAEPPQPDAEMLHRIAERELRRPVEARIEDNNVILRQREEGAIAGAVAEQTVVEDVKAETSTPEPQPEAAASAKPKRSKAERQAAREAKQAKKARKKRQADKKRKAEKAARLQAKKAAKAQQAAQDAQRAPEPEKPAQPARPAREEAPAQVAAQAEQPAKPRRKPKLSTDLSDASIAAKLQRIRAVVGHDGTDIDNEPGDSAPNNDFYAPMRDQSVDSPPEAGLLDAQLREDLLESEPEAGPEADDSLIARIADAAEILEEDSNVLAQEDQGGSDEADFADENAFAEDENEQEAPKSIAIARVVKVRKAPVPEKETPSPETAEPEIESTLSPEDEAALLAELAEVERDAPKAEAEAKATESNKGEVQPRTAFDDGGIAGADAIDRILAETDAKLMSDEASQRRASIAHLRAAVHAKRAENAGEGDQAATETEVETYREDLAEAVQPHQPTPSSDRPARRLAPLVLVSEQRIDARKASEDEAKAPVRPRRVHANAGTDPQARQPQDSGDAKAEFAAFAISKGAKGAEELLEAAAAFRVFVAGQETFSRPQVMGLVIRAEHGSIVSREEGLRAFGKLIREGVIQKIQRGRYTISENTRFRPDQARASA